ncbi:MAG TPA: hypothetical protein VKV40_23915 [Ktedonobacteraceae bacterium]|nr:hypothetical protein [Ktedonobacteraceae bacterium]
MNDQIINNLREYYDHDAPRRDTDTYADWKREERQRFLELLQLFSYHTDEYVRQVVQRYFEIVSFKVIPFGWEHKTHFQSMILRRKEAG